MPVDINGAQQTLLEAAKERLSFGPPPSWTRPCSLRPDFKAKQPGHQTYLAVDRQFHAESRQTFVHTAVRLETLQGVHRQSQWRVDFDPAIQTLTVHSITIHRGNLKMERAEADKFHIVNRETGDHVDTERIAALALLEDIRPGDIIESSYTIADENPILGEYATAMFTAPPGTPVGMLQFVLRFGQSRPMKWKSFEPVFSPAETLEGAEIIWTWKRENHPGALPEENTPDWFIDYPWAQISDCSDWESISTGLAEAWKDDPIDASLGQLARKIAHEHDGLPRQVEHAIEMVQDEFRALPTDPATLLRPPPAAGLVARRHFGDSKELAFLLCRLLQCLHVKARPVLVNSAWRQSLRTLLPMALFDHVLVEYQVRGETRWVDPTLKRQGGGSLNRVVLDYGVGLPIAPSAELTSAPDTAAQTSLYEMREVLLLDTSGAPSWLGVNIAARGSQAEDLRREFEAEGAAAIARKRLQQCAARFGEARRIGELEYRDDRAANVFLLAEGFEIKGFLKEDAKPGFYKLTLPNDLFVNALKMPDVEARRTPFAVPFPCNIVHIVEVHCLALANAVAQTRDIESPFAAFSRFRKALSGDWTTKYSLTTLADAVPPEDIEKYRQTLREIRAEAAWSLLVPAGQARPHQRGDFGRLPSNWQQSAGENAPATTAPFRTAERVAAPVSASTKGAAETVTPRPKPAPSAAAVSGGRAREMMVTDHLEETSGNGSSDDGDDEYDEAAAADPADPNAPPVRRKRRKRHRRHRRKEEKLSFRVVFWVLVATALAVVFIYLITRGGGPILPNVDPPGAALPNPPS